MGEGVGECVGWVLVILELMENKTGRIMVSIEISIMVPHRQA